MVCKEIIYNIFIVMIMGVDLSSDTIPALMKRTVDDKYFNVECDGIQCKRFQCIPCFKCAKQYRYYFCEIDTIDDIEVTVLLLIDPDNYDRKLQCIFEIHCDSIICEDYKKTIIHRDENKFTFELEDWKFIFEKIINIMSNIRFDKFQSYFTTEPFNDHKLVITNFLCENITKLTKKYDVCCVCWENTKRRAICCKGYICAPCYLSIKPKLCSDCSHGVVNDDCEIFGCNERPCPLCRKSMYSAFVYNNEEFD
jgi:hypothetical protein